MKFRNQFVIVIYHWKITNYFSSHLSQFVEMTVYLVLGDLATVIRTKGNANLTNEILLTLLLNEWPRTIAET